MQNRFFSQKVVLNTLEKAIFAFVSILLVLLGFIQGLQVYEIRLDFFWFVLEFLWLDAAFSSFAFTAFFVVSTLAWFVEGYQWKSSESEPEGSITCVVPCYQDSEVLERSVQSLLNSSYSDFEVVVVCEKNDSESIERAEELVRHDKVDLLVNTRYPGSKAGAMNHAAEETESDYLAFFDADQVVQPDFMSQVVSLLQEKDVVVGRNVPKPDGFVESFSYYESVFFTYVSRQLLSIFTDFRLVGSRSVGMRREVFEKLDGYRDDTLVEDYDLTHRCYIQDFDVVNVPLPVENLAAHSFKDWWGQRKRWMTGYCQVFTKRIHRLFTNYQNYRSILSVLIAGASFLGSLLMLTLVSKFLILLVLGAEMIYMVPIISLMVLGLAFRIHDKKYCSVESIGFSWIALPLIFPLFSIITIKSFVEYIFNSENNWYRVEK